MLTCIDVKFIFDSVRLGLSSSANILHIADVALRVVFLLFLPCFWLLFRLVPAVVLTLETSEMSAIFFHNQKQLNLVPRSSRLTCLPLEGCIFDVISSWNTKFFQIWLSVTGYAELCVCCAFSQSEFGEIFWMNNNNFFCLLGGCLFEVGANSRLNKYGMQ